jgi:hypothetical protein
LFRNKGALPPNSAIVSLGQIPTQEGCHMAKARVRSRITIEVAPDVRDKIAEWAVSEGRGVSNLLRRVLSDVVNKRMAARSREAVANTPVQKQQLSA